MPNPRKPRSLCPACGCETPKSQSRYCNVRCQQEYQYRVFINKWQRGEVIGLKSNGVVSNRIKRFLREKYNDQCCLCGWNLPHPQTGITPLVAHHIDGDWRNNREENLQLLCPNCHSLTGTYCGRNKNRSEKAAGRQTAFRPPRRQRFREAQGILQAEKENKNARPRGRDEESVDTTVTDS